MAEDRYVILTGSKNNAGDFLIASRSKELLAQERPDRDLIEYPRWEPLTEEKLEIINASKGVLLTGGPALQYELYPGIYPLVPNLEDIHVPLIMMGIGYKCHNGSWEATRDYELAPSSHALLQRIEDSGYISGVRDYHTLNVLLSKGYRNFQMTGCPALYDLERIGQPMEIPEKRNIQKVVFSFGVLHKKSPKMLGLYLRILERVKEWVNEEMELLVAFHHRLREGDRIQEGVLEKLDQMGIPYEDISGGDERLRTLYQKADIHVGMRVHAHLYMCSRNKPSVLLSEDGRAIGMRSVLGGMIFDPYRLKRLGLWERVKIKAGVLKDLYEPYDGILEDLFTNLDHELERGGERLKEVRSRIDMHFHTMRSFLAQLP